MSKLLLPSNVPSMTKKQKLIRVYQVGVEGGPKCGFTSLTEAMKDAKLLTKNTARGNRVVIKIFEMTKQEWEDMPGFEGYDV